VTPSLPPRPSIVRAVCPDAPRISSPFSNQSVLVVRIGCHSFYTIPYGMVAVYHTLEYVVKHRWARVCVGADTLQTKACSPGFAIRVSR
jgi:hypothetical protein